MSASHGSESQPTKRMRLGTKSCVECRRRKVRCIFEEGRTTCNACALHDAVCESQQQSVRRTTTPSTTSSTSEPVERIGALALSNASDISQSESSPYAYQDEDVPLLRMMKESSLLSPTVPENVAKRKLNESGSLHSAKAYIQALVDMIPAKDDLAFILRLTEPYWYICPVMPSRSDSKQHPGLTVQNVQTFIYDSIASGNPAIAAKAVLWLTHCLQQLPKGFDVILAKCGTSAHTTPTSGRSRDGIINSLLDGSEVLVSMDVDSGGTHEGVECGVLQAYNYIALGRPCKAWSVVRRAINCALLIGLPRKSPDDPLATLWPHMWQFERMLSMTLGLPYSIASSHPSISKKPHGIDVLHQVMHDIGIIVGRIIDRNQDYDQVDYGVTQQIHYDLVQNVSIPLDRMLSNHDPSCSPSLADVYRHFVLSVFHWNTQKYLHLPYAFKSAADGQQNYPESEAHTIYACKKILECYGAFRSADDQTPLMVCDLMDFQAFSSAMVLIIYEFKQTASCMFTRGQTDTNWPLILDFTKTLTKVSAARNCAVTRQALDVLTYFSDLYYARGPAPKAREIVAPYFGKIRVSLANTPVGSMATSPANQISMHADISSMGSFGMGADFQTGAELASDWMDSINWDGDFDFNWDSTLTFDSFGGFGAL